MPRTDADARILTALATYTQRTGVQLRDMTGLGPGRLYPALMRLEAAGQIDSAWEDMPPPRRRRYRLALDAMRAPIVAEYAQKEDGHGRRLEVG